MKKEYIFILALCLIAILGTVMIASAQQGYYQPAPPPSPFSPCSPTNGLYPTNCGRPPVYTGNSNVVPVIGQNQPVPVIGQNQPVPVIGQYQPVPVIGQNQPVPVIGQYQPVPVIGQYQPVPVIGQNQPVPVIGQNQQQVTTVAQWQANGTLNLTWTIRNVTNEAWASSNIDILCIGGQYNLTNQNTTRWDIPYTVQPNASLSFTVNIFPPARNSSMTFSMMDGGVTVYTFNVPL